MQIFNSVNDFKELLPTLRNIGAFLWDMDGTICNTESIHAKALETLLQDDQKGSTHSVAQLEEWGLGLTDTMVFQKLQAKGYFTDLDTATFLDKKSQVYINLIESCPVAQIFHSEIIEVLKLIQNHGHKLAVVTSSEYAPTQKTLNHLKILHYFDFIITQESTKKNKPDPAPYKLAMDHFKLKPSEVFILEDSPTGLAAAKASGAHYAKVCWY